MPSRTLAGNRRARLGVTAVFGALGMLSGSFAARVPALKGQLHLDAAGLGTALLGPALGSVLAAPLTAAALRRVTPRRWILAGLVPFAGLLPLSVAAGGPGGLLAILTGWGFAGGSVDVAINTEAAKVERRAGRRVMSGFHATYSVGALAGGGVGALCASLGVGEVTEWAVTGAAILAAGGLATAWLPAGAVGSPAGAVGSPARAVGSQAGAAEPPLDAVERPVQSLRPSRGGWRQRRQPLGRWRDQPRRLLLTSLRPVLAMCALCMCAFLAEGAVNDWSAVYLHTSLGAAPGLAALAFAAFQTTMVAGRLTGDRLTARFGPVRLVRATATAGAAGLGAALLAGTVPASMVGFALLGAGLAVTVPLTVTAAAGLGGRGGSPVAAVVACGYVGLLAGPPAIGFLAQHIGVRDALGLVVALVALVAVLAGRLEPPAPRHSAWHSGRRIANCE